jgi:hypothetical protein
MNLPQSGRHSRIAVLSWLCVLLLSAFNGCHPQPLTEVHTANSEIGNSPAHPD